jgi:hypothetical protein
MMNENYEKLLNIILNLEKEGIDVQIKLINK